MIKLTESLKPMHNIHRKSYILRVAAFGIYSRWTDSWWVLYPRWRMMTHGRGIEGEGLPFSVGPGALMGFKRGRTLSTNSPRLLRVWAIQVCSVANFNKRTLNHTMHLLVSVSYKYIYIITTNHNRRTLQVV